MNVKEAARLPSLDWEVLCKNSPYKGACVHCQNLLTLGGRHTNCFASALVNQPMPSLPPKAQRLIRSQPRICLVKGRYMGREKIDNSNNTVLELLETLFVDVWVFVDVWGLLSGRFDFLRIKYLGDGKFACVQLAGSCIDKCFWRIVGWRVFGIWGTSIKKTRRLKRDEKQGMWQHAVF